MNYAIFPPTELPANFKPRLPLSKSISNRALIIDALSGLKPGQREVAKCDDTDAMIAALNDENATAINVGAAGTTMRFLTAYYASQPGYDVTIDGSDRMRERPIEPLVDALRQCGAEISYLNKEGFPPLSIKGRRLKGGEITIDPGTSSQFVSALLMIAPTMEHGLSLALDSGQLVSTPYIDMTIAMMLRRGIKIDETSTCGKRMINVAPGIYGSDNTPIEQDWSAASYWIEFQTLSGCTVEFDSSPDDSLQGDSKVFALFDSLLNGTQPVELDFMLLPDLAQTLMATAVLKKIPFRFTGLKTLLIKETDRIAAMKAELQKLGADVVDDRKNFSVEWNGNLSPVAKPPVIATYNDHRMAMSLALSALNYPGIVIRDVTVVDKSYPGFWDDMRRAGFILKPQ